MALETNVLRTIIEAKGAENTARQFAVVGNAASETEKKLRAMADRANAVSLVAGGIGVGMLAASKSLLSVAGAAEQAEIAFTTLLKSPQEAKRHLKELADFAANTPFEFAGLRTMSTQLLAFGFQSQAVIPMLRTLGDAGSALGQGPEGLSRIIRAIGQMQAKGRLQMQELLQLAEAGVPVFQILQDQLGLTAEQVGEIGRQGVDAKTGIAALLRGMDAMYGGGMAKQAESLNGVVSNLKDQLGLLGMEIGETMIPAAKTATKWLIDMTEAIREAPPGVKRAIGAFLLFGGVGMILVSVGARVVNLVALWKLAAVQKAASSAKAVGAEKAEQSAVLQTAVAYERKALALRQSVAGREFASSASFELMSSGRGAWFDSGRSWLNPGRLGGMAGQAQQMIGFSMAAARASEGLLDSSLDAGEKIGKLGAAAGYAAGAFNPLILAATMAAEALGKIIDNYVGKRAAKAAADAGERPGMTSPPPGELPPNWTSTPVTDPMKLRQQYHRWMQGTGSPEMFEPGSPGDTYRWKRQAQDPRSPWTAFMAAAQRNWRSYTRTQVQQSQAATAGASLGEAEAAVKAAEAHTANAKAMERYNIAARNGADTSARTQQALSQEAQAQRALSKALTDAASVEADSKKATELREKAADAARSAIALETEALESRNSQLEKGEQAAKKASEEEKKRRDELDKSRHAQLAGAEAAVEYFRAVKDPQGATSTLMLLGRMYDEEARIQAQGGHVAEAFAAKTKAVNAYSEALKAQNTALSESMNIGGAYATYLDTIGAEDAADAYRRSTMAGQAASIAQTAFGAGDAATGWQAAAEAEKLARAGRDGRRGSIGFGGRGGGALTGAVPIWAMEAAGRQASAINIRIDNTVRDEAGTTRARMRREDRVRAYRVHGM